MHSSHVQVGACACTRSSAVALSSHKPVARADVSRLATRTRLDPELCWAAA